MPWEANARLAKKHSTLMMSRFFVTGGIEFILKEQIIINLLGRTVIAKDMDSAIKFARDNKYSFRTYNDYNQYLIFPLLFMDEKGKKKRDLSLPISLNKDNNKNALNKAKSNQDIQGFFFNQHYTAGGFILFYMVRLIPFTYAQIEFQSGKFDFPARLFSTLKSFLFFLSIT